MRDASRPIALLVGLLLLAGGAGAGEGCAIAGRVVSPDGRPVAGARILLTTDPRPRWPGSFATPEGAPAAISDADGRYVAEGLEPTSYYVAAWKHGHGVGEYGAATEWRDRFAVRLRAGERAEGIDLMVLHLFRLRGTVADELGRPLDGAQVFVTVDYPEGDEQGAGGAANDDGTYDLGPWPLRGPGELTLRFHHALHEFREISGIRVEPGAEIVAPVAKALLQARAEGVVVSGDGTPCAGVTVRCRQQAVAADRDGRFELMLPPRPARLRAEARKGEPLVPGPRLDLKPGRTVAVRIVVGPPRTIRGRVVDARGRPRAGVTVAAVPTGDERSFAAKEESVTQSNDRGEFELGRLRGRLYRVVALDDAHDWLQLEEDAHAVTVRAGARGVTLVHAPIVVKGRYGGLDEWPRVKLITPRGPDHPEMSFNSEGFRVRVREPGTYRIQVEADGRATHVSRALVLEAGQTLDLGPVRFRRPCTVRGLVRDNEGRPLRHAKVHFADARTGVLYDDLGGTFTDVAGRFEKGALPAGTYTVFAMTPGHALAIRRRVAVGPGAPAETELVAPEPAPLVVRVVDHAGNPVPNARFRYRPEGLPIFVLGDYRTYEPPSYGAERTGVDGMVRKPLLPPGDVEIEVEAEDGARSLGRASVRAREETRFEIRLE